VNDERKPSDEATGVASEEPKLELTTTCARWVNLASTQNSLPIVRELQLKWPGSEVLTHIEIAFESEPCFSHPCVFRIDRLDPGERQFTDVRVLPAFDRIAGVSESHKATLTITARSGGQELCRSDQQIRVLPPEQWEGANDIPELLAAYIQPNHPYVGRILSNAAQLLKRFGIDGFLGYQRESRDIVGKQLAAIYSALRDEHLAYSNPPAHFESSGQRLRLPDQIGSERLATCLDLAVLYASCLEQAGLHSLIMFSEGHAWAGCWLEQHLSLSSPFEDDGETLRKRLAIGELAAFELTRLADKKALVSEAQALGARNLSEESKFIGALDLRMAREAGIRPIPPRTGGVFELPKDTDRPGGADEAGPPDAIDLPPSIIIGEVEGDGEAPNQRLERWKRKLLDLSLRNRLLNFRPTAKTLRVLGDELGRLEDKLAGDHSFGFEPNPNFEKQIDASTQKPIPKEAAEERLRTHLAASLDRGKLILAEDDKAKIETRLVDLFRTARIAEEEGGVSPVYLALGILQWKESEHSAITNRAPLLLVPVTIERSSVRAGLSGIKLVSRDEDTRINPTLLEKLRKDFGIAFDIPEVAPADESGVDVDRVLSLFRHLVVNRRGWEVKSEIWLGEFSFRKFLMWRDLQDRDQALRANPIVRQMLENPHVPLASQGRFPSPRELDRVRPADQVFAPLIADSSQLAAIFAAADGKSFVLEGPPGTGKSQTITNLIAHCLGHGKSVLFVSEKRAALEVVRKRLGDVGLGPYCLEVHSDKARKAEIIEQLKAPLEAAIPNIDRKWKETTSALSRTRENLNRYVEELHSPYPCGLTLFDACSWLCRHPEVPSIQLAWGDPSIWNRHSLPEMRAAAGELDPIFSKMGLPSRSAFRGSNFVEWSPAAERELLRATESIIKHATESDHAATAFSRRLSLESSSLSFNELVLLTNLGGLLEKSALLPRGIENALENARARESLPEAIDLLNRRRLPASWIASRFRNSVLAVDIPSLRAIKSISELAWWPKKLFARLKFRKLMRMHASQKMSGQTIGDTAQADLDSIEAIQKLDKSLAGISGDLKSLLGQAWKAEETDLKVLQDCEQWIKDVTDLIRSLGRLELERTASLTKAFSGLTRLGAEDIRRNGSLAKEIGRFKAAIQEAAEAIRTFECVGQFPAGIPINREAQGFFSKTRESLTHVKASIGRDELRYWAAWQRSRCVLAEMDLSAFVDFLDRMDEPVSAEQLLDGGVNRWLFEEGLGRTTYLKNFIGQSHDNLIDQFRRLDGDYVQISSRAVAAAVAKRVPTEGSDEVAGGEFSLLNRELNKKTRHKPLRQLFKGMPKLLPRLKPCLLMSPLSVAQHLDAEFPPFDLVVFDEASQIPVWDAIGAIGRARQAVIVGDPKQMPPTTFFSRADEDDEVDDGTEDLESILDETMTVLPVLRLQWHYRSKYESLITFSNHRYYDGKLVTFPSPIAHDRAVALHRVAGRYGRGTTRVNQIEALDVVNFVLGHLRGPYSKTQSIGIVTFNIQQQQLIEDLLDKARREDAELEVLFEKGVGKEEVFVKNLENVQGDERDIIVFSTTFGPDDHGKLSLNFGPINGANGPRRLNVAVSRARHAMHVFTSMPPEQIDLSRTSSIGVRHLKEFLDYADRGIAAIGQTAKFDVGNAESPFEVAVSESLRARGWEIHHQIGCGGYRIDMAVVDPEAPGSYLLGIECDGASYHSAANARDRDRLRQMKLEDLGWRLHRIWSTDWWRRQNECIEILDEKIRSLIKQRRVVDQASDHSNFTDATNS
jgi:very-short-patch-repair endonuclease